jgi:hypothetical protein
MIQAGDTTTTVPMQLLQEVCRNPVTFVLIVVNQSTDTAVGVKRKPDDDAQSISSDSVVKKPKKITAVRFVVVAE